MRWMTKRGQTSLSAFSSRYPGIEHPIPSFPAMHLNRIMQQARLFISPEGAE